MKLWARSQLVNPTQLSRAGESVTLPPFRCRCEEMGRDRKGRGGEVEDMGGNN